MKVLTCNLIKYSKSLPTKKTPNLHYSVYKRNNICFDWQRRCFHNPIFFLSKKRETGITKCPKENKQTFAFLLGVLANIQGWMVHCYDYHCLLHTTHERTRTHTHTYLCCYCYCRQRQTYAMSWLLNSDGRTVIFVFVYCISCCCFC